MKRNALILSMMLIFIMALSLGVFAQADKAQYVGSAKCKMCHSSKARGNSYGIWAESKHAKPFTALLFVARCCERIGDHIQNLAENVHFIVLGETYRGS